MSFLGEHHNPLQHLEKGSKLFTTQRHLVQRFIGNCHSDYWPGSYSSHCQISIVRVNTDLKNITALCVHAIRERKWFSAVLKQKSCANALFCNKLSFQNSSYRHRDKNALLINLAILPLTGRWDLKFFSTFSSNRDGTTVLQNSYLSIRDTCILHQPYVVCTIQFYFCDQCV